MLHRTREETQVQSPGGCLLAENLTKQIQRRLSQLDSFSVPSRDVSVIRCASTPDNSPRQCVSNFTFGDCQQQPTTLQQLPSTCSLSKDRLHATPQHQPEFRVFLDQPTQFYNLGTPLSPPRIQLTQPEAESHISIVSTDSSDLISHCCSTTGRVHCLYICCLSCSPFFPLL